MGAVPIYPRMAQLFTDMESGGVAQTKGSRQAAKYKGQQLDRIRKAMEGIRDDMTRGDIYDFVIEFSGAPGYQIVTSLLGAYLRDQSMTEILDAEFWLLGKVAKLVSSSSKDSINLLRRSTLRGLNEEMIQQMFAAFKNIGERVLQIPELKTKVGGPAMQIIPIAIYV